MNYTHSVEERIAHFFFEGDLIGENNGPELVELVGELIAKGVTQCSIDISKVRFINSSGIGVMITLLTKFRNKGGDLVLVNPSEQVRKLLIITKLNAIFSIVKNKEEAVQSLTKS